MVLPILVLALVFASTPLEAQSSAAVAEAVKACQGNLESKVQPGPLNGPALVIKRPAGGGEWAYMTAVGGSEAAAVKTVFCVQTSVTVRGKYTDGTSASDATWAVTALSWPDAIVRRKDNLIGFAPYVKKSSESGTGTVDSRRLEEWLYRPAGSALVAEIEGVALLSPDKTTLAVGGLKDGKLVIGTDLLDWPSRRLRTKLGMRPVAFLGDGRLVTYDKGGYAFWDVSKGKRSGGIKTQYGDFSRDGRVFVSYANETRGAWDVATGRRISGLEATAGTKVTLFHGASSMSADGRLACAAGFPENKLLLWDLTQDRQAADLGLAARRGPSACAFVPDGQSLVAYAGSPSELWRVAIDGQAAPRRLGPVKGAVANEAPCLAVSNGGRWLAVGVPGQIQLWDLDAGKAVSSEVAQIRKECSLAFSSDDSLLVHTVSDFASSGSQTRTWDVLGLATAAARP